MISAKEAVAISMEANAVNRDIQGAIAEAARLGEFNIRLSIEQYLGLPLPLPQPWQVKEYNDKVGKVKRVLSEYGFSVSSDYTNLPVTNTPVTLLISW